MGVNQRTPGMLAWLAEQQRDRAAMADALATVEDFNARLRDGKQIWAWPTIGAALATKYHWHNVACDSCDQFNALDLTMKPRHPDA